MKVLNADENYLHKFYRMSNKSALSFLTGKWNAARPLDFNSITKANTDTQSQQ